MKASIVNCQAFKVGGNAPANAHFVEAVLSNGKTVIHQGPSNSAFFTEQEASAIATKVFCSATIETNYWITSQGKTITANYIN